MKAVVFQAIGDIRLVDVPDPELQQPTDAVVRLTVSAICGTDLHMIRGTLSGMKAGTILGHEGVGVVEKIGPDVRNLEPGDRVLIPSTIACGYCSYCRHGYFAQCDNANPHGKTAGTAFYGGPEDAGGFHGLQAQKARIPMASVNLVKLPANVADDDAILLSDIFPTGYFGADMAHIREGHTVAVFGCGPVGQFAIISAKLMGAGRIFAIDAIPDRLAKARAQGAETIDFEREDPVEVLRSLTGGIGVDRAIDAVGVDANSPRSSGNGQRQQFDAQVRQVAPDARPSNGNWHPGDAPSQVHLWAVEALAKAGTLAIIGVYPQTHQVFPIGAAFMKNLTIRGGNCNHRKYIPELIRLVQSGVVKPSQILTQAEGIGSVIDAYKAFDERQPGWMKVELRP